MGAFVLYLNRLDEANRNPRITRHIEEYFGLPIRESNPFLSPEYKALAREAESIVILGAVEGIDLKGTAAPVFHIDGRGALQPLNGQIDARKYAAFRETIFGRLGGPRNNEYKFFPFGYLAAHTGLGHVNRCGFRIKKPLEALTDRPSDHLVVAVFGGSTVFSTYCYDHEMFTHRIEAHLKQILQSHHEAPSAVDVLNFGQVGSVVLNNILTWMTFCHRVKPDIVICHFGWNDLALGMVTDPVLLADHDITYAYPFEEWARVLHSTRDEVSTSTHKPVRIRNNPQDAVGALMRRIQQFSDLVTGTGGRFIAGLQPIAESKSGLHPQEKAVARAANNPDLELVFNRIGHLFQMTSEALAQLQNTTTIDFYRDFSRFGADNNLFADKVHCRPAGDEILGETYAERIQSLLGDRHASQ